MIITNTQQDMRGSMGLVVSDQAEPYIGIELNTVMAIDTLDSAPVYPLSKKKAGTGFGPLWGPNTSYPLGKVVGKDLRAEILTKLALNKVGFDDRVVSRSWKDLTSE